MTLERLSLGCDDVDELAGLYVLDALEATEAQAVASHLQTCPNPHREFAVMAGAVPALFEAVEPIEPPAELRDRVLAAVAETRQEERRATISPASIAAPRTAGASRPADVISFAEARERRSGSRNVWRTVLAAAAVLLIVALGATSLAFARRAADAQARADTLSAAIAASLDPNSEVAGLHGSGTAASASGFAAFPRQGPGYIVIRGLPAVDAGKTYQAWFLAGKNAYPSVLIEPGSDGLAIIQGLPIMQGADAVALTIEAAGGAQTPSGAPVVVGTMQPGPVAQIVRTALVSGETADLAGRART